jgi:hypothetical protein
MVNKEDVFDEEYDSDGKMGPFNNRTDREGQQLFNEDDDDDGVGFVAERATDVERHSGAAGYMDVADCIDDEVHVHVSINQDTLNKMNLNQLKNELKLRQQSSFGAKFKLKERLIKSLDKKPPKHTEESLAKKKAAASEAKKKNPTQGLISGRN